MGSAKDAHRHILDALPLAVKDVYERITTVCASHHGDFEFFHQRDPEWYGWLKDEFFFRPDVHPDKRLFKTLANGMNQLEVAIQNFKKAYWESGPQRPERNLLEWWVLVEGAAFMYQRTRGTDVSRITKLRSRSCEY